MPVETYVSYALNRMADTAVGVVMSLLINYLLPRERLVHWLEVAKLRREKKIPYTSCFVESWASKWGEWVTKEKAIWN